MTKGDFDLIIEKIKNCMTMFNETIKEDKVNILYLANSDTINYSVKKENIPHLLGINLDYLVNLGLLKNDNKYTMLEKFIDDNYSFYKKIHQGFIDSSKLFSEYVNEKLDIFEYQVRHINVDDVLFVCKYDKSKNYTVNEVEPFTADYYIVRSFNNDDLAILGLIKNDYGSYSLQTNRPVLSDKKEDTLKSLLTNQELTYITCIKGENPNDFFYKPKPYYLLMERKKNVIKKINDICDMYNASANYKKDSLNNVITCLKMKDNQFGVNELLSELSKTIATGNIFDISKLDDDIKEHINDEIRLLINRYNNLVSSNSFNETNKELYSDVEKRKNKLEEENKEKEEKIASLLEEKRLLEEEKLLLEEQKRKLEEEKDKDNNFKSKLFKLIDEERN